MTYPRLALNILKSKLNLSPQVYFVTFFVTLRCNHKCIMCDVWKNQKHSEMSLGEIEKIFQQLKNLDVLRVTGGEPFLREDLADIIEIIQRYSRPSIIHITTNGSLTEAIYRILSQLEDLSNIHIKISIDAVGDNHDRIRGVSGAWKKALATLSMLEEFRKRELFVAVNQTIAERCSIEDRQRLKRICDDLNLPLLTQIAYANSVLYMPERNISSLPKEEGAFCTFCKFNKPELNSLFNELVKDIQSIPSLAERMVKKYYLRGLQNRLLYSKADPHPACVALESHLRILPDGAVPICLFDSTIVGSLKNQSLQQLYGSPAFRQGRAKVERCKGCWAECEVVPSGIYTGDLFRSFSY